MCSQKKCARWMAVTGQKSFRDWKELRNINTSSMYTQQKWEYGKNIESMNLWKYWGIFFNPNSMTNHSKCLDQEIFKCILRVFSKNFIIGETYQRSNCQRWQG